MSRKAKDLLDHAESLICNANPLAHCSQLEWDEAVKRWRDDKHNLFPDGVNANASRELVTGYVIGQRVTVQMQGQKIDGHIRAIIFTSSKVRYSVRALGDETTIHNIDSTFVFSEPNAEVIPMPEDNYS